MAVSGSKNFAITRSDIIESALRKLGVYDQGEAIDGNEVNAANFALNLMVKQWVTEGADLFLRTESTLFLQPDTQSYTLSNDHITDSYAETTLTADVATSGTTLTVSDNSSMNDGDYIGIKLDDNTIHWTTIVSAATPTITTGLASAASSGNKVYSYTTKSDRPQKIVYAYRSDKNGFDTEIKIVGEFEYRRQSNKTADGPPVEIWYNPQGNQSTGKLWVWPDDGGANWDKLVLICQHYPDDFDASSDNADFPIEWGRALVWGLAADLASEYGVTENEQARLWATANNFLEKALDYDVEDASVRFVMDCDR